MTTLRFLLAMIWLLPLTACGIFTPVLHVAYIDEVPAPNGIVETPIWSQATPLKLKLRPCLGRTPEARPAEVRAIYDGRAISLLVAWPDASETILRRSWEWNSAASQYHLDEHPVDSLSLLWPMRPGTLPAAKSMFAAHPALFDCWRWVAAWSNLSNVADDGLLHVDVFTDPAAAGEGGAWKTKDSKHLARQRFEFDAGRPGTLPTRQPREYIGISPPGAYAETPLGSAADVTAHGVFNHPKIDRPIHWFINGGQRTPGTWFGDDPMLLLRGVYFVEFYRVLVPKASSDDVTLGPGRPPQQVQLRIEDDSTLPDWFESPLITLKFKPLRTKAF